MGRYLDLARRALDSSAGVLPYELNETSEIRGEPSRATTEAVEEFVAQMPQGIRLIEWCLKEPPVALESCAVVVDPASFARTTLEQLRVALENPKQWVGWSIPQLVDRLAQVGVTVEVSQ
jgi:hypothetical protein